MSMIGLTLVVIAAVGFTAFDFTRKRLSERIDVAPLLFLLTLGSIPLYVAWLWIDPGRPLDSGYFLPGLGSAALNILANLAFLRSVQVSALSVAIPLLSLTPVFVSLVSIPVLGEVLDARQWVGILLVVAGAILLQMVGRSHDARESVVRRWQGPLLMVSVALLWSLTMPFDKLAMDHASPAFHGLVLHIAVVLGCLPLMGGKWGQLRRAYERRGLVVFAIVAGSTAVGVQLVALGYVYAGLVETLKRGLGSMFSLVLGAVGFGEKITASRVLAVVMMTIGVAVISLV